MRSLNPACLNFLDTSDARFSALQNALDNVFRELRTEGVGATSKQAEVFTKDEEYFLWDSGVMSSENPKSLLRAVFYLNGKNFCLRGGEEHRGLKISQLKKEREPLCYVYTENASKNRTGGLAQMRVKNKVVKIESVPAAGTKMSCVCVRCILQ